MEICIYSTTTSINVSKYDTNYPSVKEKLQSSQSFRCGHQQRVGGWAEESLGIKKDDSILFPCPHWAMRQRLCAAPAQLFLIIIL